MKQGDECVDPALQWAGKAEHTSFEVPTVSLQVHGRIDPKTIIQAVKKKNGANLHMSLFDTPEENPPINKASEKEGWAKLAKNLKAEIDEDLIEAYRGTESLAFEAGEYKRIAVKIVDDRGIESLKIMDLE